MIKTVFACALVLTFTGIQACGRHGCTDIGCSDQLSGTITTKDGTWSDGSYVITITADETSYQCSLQLPEDFPENGSLRTLQCQPELSDWSHLTFRQDTVCTETVTDNASSQSCDPIPDQYTLSFGLEGTPEAVTIQVERDGAVLVEQDFIPSYKENQPNGKGCSPVCRQGAVEVQVP
jgi:hypothetical protein